MTNIELLAPAANLSSGKAAIDAGADAVYIGGPAFGAREKAGNSIEDISKLAQYAHMFGAQVYMTMNTIVYDNELAEAESLAKKAWEAGVDALIIQDMAFLEMNLPPIPLHASTQTFNLTPGRVKFLEEAGFDRIILERGINLSEIKEIRDATKVELEAFVHGAICVGYSGQCYLSQALCGRSGNRGACAQPCRSLWTVVDENGEILVEKRAILSVGDLNLSENMEELISAGVTSLKIEGRLKDEGYVVNNVAHYNRKLSEIGVSRTSSGLSNPSFEPNPEKSFSRSFSNYFLLNRIPEKSLLNHSQGEYLGKVEKVGPDYFELDRDVKINNGDGIVFLRAGENFDYKEFNSGVDRNRTIGSRNKDGASSTMCGTNVNITQDGRIFPNRMDGIRIGVDIFRNLDRSFVPKANRKIDVSVRFEEGRVVAKDCTGIEVFVDYPLQEKATNEERAMQNIRSSFSKSGDTIFRVNEVDVFATPFMPMSQLNDLRRLLLDKLLEERLKSYKRPLRIAGTEYPPIALLAEKADRSDSVTLDYRANVANRLAKHFYEKCGVCDISPAFEIEKPQQDVVLLRTRHCIRRELGVCLKDRGVSRTDIFIENNGRKFKLKFDCAACEMTILG